MMRHSLKTFLGDDSGAVTVDWVALVSATLLLGTMVIYAVFNHGVTALVFEINDTMSSADPSVATGPAPDFAVADISAELPPVIPPTSDPYGRTGGDGGHDHHD